MQSLTITHRSHSSPVSLFKQQNPFLARLVSVAMLSVLALLLTTAVVFAHGGISSQRSRRIDPAAAANHISLSITAAVTDTKAMTGTKAVADTKALTDTKAMTGTKAITNTQTTTKTVKAKKLVRINVTVRTQFSIRLRLRAEPSTDSELLTYLDNGTTWSYIEYSKDSKWVRIAVPGFGEDGSGWISAEWIEVEEVYE